MFPENSNPLDSQAKKEEAIKAVGEALDETTPEFRLKLAVQFINKGFGEAVFAHLDKFLESERSELVVECINKGFGEVVFEHLDKFPEPERVKIAEILATVGYAKNVFGILFSSFEGRNRYVLAEALIEAGLYKEISGVIDRFPKEERAALGLRILDEAKTIRHQN